MITSAVHRFPARELVLSSLVKVMPAKGGGSDGGPQRRASEQSSGVKTERKQVVFMVGHQRELLLYRAEFLSRSGFSVVAAETKAEAIATIKRGGFDAAILSYTLTSDTVEELSEMIRQSHPECPVISISRTGSEDRHLHPDEIVVGDEGPQALIKALQRALRKRVQ